MNEIRNLEELKEYEQVIMEEIVRGAKVGYSDNFRTVQCYYIPNAAKTIICRVTTEEESEYFHGKEAMNVLMQIRTFRKTVKDYKLGKEKEDSHTSAHRRNMLNTIPIEYFPVHPMREVDEEVIERNRIDVASRVEERMQQGVDFDNAWTDVSFCLKQELAEGVLYQNQTQGDFEAMKGLLKKPGEAEEIKLNTNVDTQKRQVDEI